MATPAIGSSVLTRRGVLAAAASTLLLSACGRDEGRDGGTAGPPAGFGELVVGVSLELTGPGATLGVPQERALRITADTLNEYGVPVGNQRLKIRLEVRDNGSDPRLAARHAAELATRDDVHALLGATLAETSLGIIRVAQRVRVPYLSLAYGDGIVHPLADRTFVYKVTPDAEQLATRLVTLLKEQSRHRVALLAGHGLHGDSGVAAIGAAVDSAGLHLAVTSRLPATGTSFLTAARAVVRKAPDAVVIWANAPDSGAAARALRQAGYRGRLYFDAAGVAEDTLDERNAPAVEGAYAVHPLSLGDSTLTNTSTGALALRDLSSRYLHRYGSYRGFAPYASDALTLIVGAARAAGSLDRGRVRAYLRNQGIEGMTGAYAFEPNKHSGLDPSALGIYRVINSGWNRIS
ncbi:ABC transporter substrate-binding protein [Micromonospora sp. CPCC 205711]|uniref:ABC transporter substrate-binding protein n=1 Tax=Micromonospora sp. CPCC 205547 TaxID=3122400 RepID=UPI002FF0A6C8